jgi:GT2 family glycosyltransferase
VKLCVLMLSADEAPLLEHSLPAAIALEPDELLVVDNGSSDGSAELAERLGARCLRLESRVSYCEAMNAGLRATRGEAVALLTADVFVQPGFGAASLAALAPPDVASVAPRLLRTAGPRPEQHLEELDAAGMTIDRRRKNGLVGHAAPSTAYARAGEVFGADGAGAVYRRAALDDVSIGGEVFDTNLELWASDADLAWRARLMGWRSVYAPDAVARHIRHYSPTTRATVSETSRRIQFRNRYLMMVSNDSGREVLRDLHRILLYEVLALGHVLLRERHLLGAYADAWRRLGPARRRRREISRRRVARTPFGLEPPR